MVVSLLCILCPPSALLDSCAVGIISVYGVARILCQQRTWDIRALAAVHNAFALTAHCNRAFAVERFSVSFDTSAAAVRLLIFAACAVKSAS